MADVKAMAVGESRNHLTKYSNSFRFRQVAVLTYMVEKLTPFDKLQNEVPSSPGQSACSTQKATDADLQFTPVLPDIVKTNDVRMLNELHNNHLPFDA